MKKFNKARQMLRQERDIEAYINLKRVLSLLLNKSLQKRQIQAVNFFNRYVLSEKDLSWKPVIERSAPEVDEALAEEMWHQLDPEEDMIDQIILKEISGKRVLRDDDKDSSSSDEEG